LWANGTTAREDGLKYETTDLGQDGTHPSPVGQRKVAELLLKFFKTDSTTKGWFVGR
jgi:lysophospholipase L1-like esterase